MADNDNLPAVFCEMFRGASVSFKDPQTLFLFLQEVDNLPIRSSEDLGNAFEYILSVLGTQKKAGQFRTPRHIIEFITEIIAPQKGERILDPACGSAGFLIAAHLRILRENSSAFCPEKHQFAFAGNGDNAADAVYSNAQFNGDNLAPREHRKLTENIHGYDISPDMIRLSLVNMFLHQNKQPQIHAYDTLTSHDKWDEDFEVILANPPFMSPKGGIRPHGRFAIKSNRCEVLFVDYILEHLTSRGRAGIIVPEGIIFRAQKAYKTLRKNLVEGGLCTVVSLPKGIFQPYAPVKTSILFVDREQARNSDEILFVRVENDGRDLGAQRGRIEKNDLPAAFALLRDWAQGVKTKASPLAHLWVKRKTIAANDEYNLTAEHYRPSGVRVETKWPKVRLEEICEVNPNKREIKNTPANTEVAFVPMEDMGIHDMILRSKRTRPLGEVYKGYTYFANNDVLLAKVTPCFENGKSGIARNLPNGIGFGSSEFYVYRADTKKVLPEWVYYCISSPEFIEAGKLHMTGTGGLQRLTKSFAISHHIPLPPLEFQRELVSELDGYQRVIDGARQVVENWRPQVPANPEWPLVQLGEICELARGVTYSKKDEVEKNGICILRANNIDKDSGMLNFSDIRRIRASVRPNSEKKLRCGDIFICLASGSKEHIGKVSLIERDMDFYFGGFMGAVRVREKKVDSGYLFYNLRSPLFNEFLSRRISGASINNLSARILGEFEIPLPSLKVQREIVSRLESERKRVESCRELLESHTGKIRVRVEEVWEEKTTHSDKASKPFAEAALLSVIAGRFGDEQYPLGRFRRTKFSYFVKRKAGEEVMEDFLKKAAGPYNPKARYKSESIALKKEYVRECKSERRLGFVAGPNIAEAEKYLAERWRDALAWTAENFRYKKDEELETLATVDFAMLSLSGGGEALSPKSVSAYMRADKEWQKKLKRPNFSPARIKAAMAELQRLFDYEASPKGGDL